MYIIMHLSYTSTSVTLQKTQHMANQTMHTKHKF